MHAKAQSRKGIAKTNLCVFFATSRLCVSALSILCNMSCQKTGPEFIEGCQDFTTKAPNIHFQNNLASDVVTASVFAAWRP